ncbi:hypothetical protein AB1N83_009223 [Pleurotus pulmonarius]
MAQRLRTAASTTRRSPDRAPLLCYMVRSLFFWWILGIHQPDTSFHCHSFVCSTFFALGAQLPFIVLILFLACSVACLAISQHVLEREAENKSHPRYARNWVGRTNAPNATANRANEQRTSTKGKRMKVHNQGGRARRPTKGKTRNARQQGKCDLGHG